MRTLLITNSYDQTSDLLVLKMGSDKFIRINYDRPQDWSIELTPNNLRISSELGSFDDSHISKFFWRKPFISEPQGGVFDDKFYTSEWKYLVYEISALMLDQGKLKFNPPAPDYLLSKIKQQRVAEKYLNCPKCSWTINKTPDTSFPCITKSISAATFSDDSVLYTTDVSGKELSNDIWFIQEKVKAKFDLTVVHAYGRNFGFQLNRDNLTGIDWRKDQVDQVQDWNIFCISDDLSNRINSFMLELGLVYGRLDFMNDPKFSEPYFLEVNKNGQWAWLDPKFDNGLFKMMSEIVDPTM